MTNKRNADFSAIDIEPNPIGAMSRNDGLAAREDALAEQVDTTHLVKWLARHDGDLTFIAMQVHNLTARHDAELAALRDRMDKWDSDHSYHVLVPLDEYDRLATDPFSPRDDAAQDDGIFPDNYPLDFQVDRLATVLINEFGGPTRSEGAIAMAIRVMREQKAALTADADGEEQ